MKFQMDENEKFDKDDYKPMSKSCYNNANEFFNLAFNSIENPYLSTAVFCNFAFSCELYLKSLLLNEQKNIRGHELTKLFNHLNDKFKEETYDFFKCEISKELFHLQLKESKMAFEVLRYEHEYKGMTTNALFIFQLAGCLKQIAESVIPHIQ